MKTLIVIGGPTASGKTDVAIEIAKYFHTKILSADSRQCYRELNIGVAKPDNEQLNAVEHFFINSHSIQQEVSAGEYEQYGLSKLNEIFTGSDFAVCTGGTGLYIKALCEGLDDMPPVEPAIDQQINNAYKQHGIDWLRAELAKYDPAFLTKGEMQNPNRMIRALVFAMSNGSSILTYRTHTTKKRDFAIRYFALHPERSLLYKRINERVEQMIQAGLTDEARDLLPYRHLKPLQTVGYNEMFAYFDGHYSLQEAIEKIQQHTRHYAKRQITWCRHQGTYRFVPPDYENIIAALRTQSPEND